MSPASIVAIIGICLITVRLTWICANGKDRGGRYGR